MFNQIVLLYNSESREKLMCDILKDVIVERNICKNVIVGNFYDVCFEMWKIHPDVVYSIIPRDKLSEVRLTLLKMIFQAHIICVHTEGLMNIDEENMERLVGFNQYSKNLVDAYFFWGKSLLQGALPELKKQNKIYSDKSAHIFGYIMYEKSRLQKYNLQYKSSRLVKEKGSGKSKRVLFIMGFHNADVTIQDRIEEGYFKKIDEKNIRRAEIKAKANVYYKNKYLDILDRCINRYPDYLFILKLHPVEIDDYIKKGKDLYSKYRNIENVLIIEENVPLGLIIENVDIMVHYGSTTGIEAYLYKKPTIQLVNDYEDMSCGGMGMIYFESTKMIQISNCNVAVELISTNMQFSRSTQNDAFLQDFMNFSFEEEYIPAELICNYIENIKTTNKIDINENIVKTLVLGDEAKKYIYSIFVDGVKKLFKFKIVDFIKIVKFLFVIIRIKQRIKDE